MVSRNSYLRAGPLQQEHMIDRVLLREQESALSESQHRRSGRIEAVRAGVALDASWRVAAAECARLRCVVAEAKRASHVADSGGGGNHAAVCSELRSAEAREVELHKLLSASLCEMGALIHEWAPATLESRPSVLPTAAPFGALGNHGGNSHIALRLAARRGYELLPCALHADPGRSSKLEKLRRTRGESGPLARGESDPLLALHACDWMPRVDLPRRYAQLVPVTDAAGTVHSELRLCELHEGGGSVWTALEHAGRFAEELYGVLQVCSALAEVPAAHLRTWETRAYELVLGARGAPPVARIACESDCRARYLGIRCGNKVMGERQKAFCHSLRGALHLGRYDPCVA